MAEITAKAVKDLREKTGAGMMDCKKALAESNGDMEQAIDWLRTKGLAKAAKKAGRVAAEGLVAVAVEDTKGVVVEVNSETDFVARNEVFQKMVGDIATVALDTDGDFDALAKADFPDAGKSVDDHLKFLVGTFGDNMNLRRSAGLKVTNGVVVPYVHNAAADGMGRIGVLVALESEGDKDKLKDIGRKIAMHVAAANPLALNVDELDKDVVERERQVFSEQARESGKPDNIIEKMVEGRLRKFYEEVVLLSQAFVMNPDQSIEQAVKDAEKDAGAPVKLVGFQRYALGEGIEKEETDFAAEVKAAASAS